MPDITNGVAPAQGGKLRHQADALAELPQAPVAELLAQLRLPDEHDLEQLGPAGLEVGEHPDVLEHRPGQVLGLVDDQDDAAARLVLLQQDWLRASTCGPPPLGKGDLEVAEHDLEKLLEGQVRVEDEHGLDARAQPRQDVADQRGLPGPHLAEDQDEAPPLLDPVGDVRERLLVRLAREQVLRVRGEPERALPQPVEP